MLGTGWQGCQIECSELAVDWVAEIVVTGSYEPNYFLEVDFDQNDAPEWTTLPERRNKMGSETVESNKIGCVSFE